MKDIAVVTGAARGIGLAISRRLAQEGRYGVAMMDLEEVEPAVVADLRASGAEIHVLRGDVSCEDDVETAVRRLTQTARVTAVVNNAGIFPRRAPAVDIPFSEWMQVLSVNLGGSFLMSRGFARHMADGDGGVIVNIGSGRAVGGAINGSHYSASKAGMIALTRSLALEWAPHIRVNAVMPGITDTPFIRVEGRSEDDLRAWGSRIPLGRIGLPADVAGVVNFLLSADAAFMTGQTVAVNGGSIML